MMRSVIASADPTQGFETAGQLPQAGSAGLPSWCGYLLRSGPAPANVADLTESQKVWEALRIGTHALGPHLKATLKGGAVVALVTLVVFSPLVIGGAAAGAIASSVFIMWAGRLGFAASLAWQIRTAYATAAAARTPEELTEAGNLFAQAFAEVVTAFTLVKVVRVTMNLLCLLGGRRLPWASSYAASLQTKSRGGVAYMTGTFDPIHEGHLRTAEMARKALGVDKVILVPRPPTNGKNPVDVADRLRMMRLAVRGHHGIAVADGESVKILFQRGDDALIQHLEQAVKGPLYRIAGTDSFLKQLQGGFVKQHLRSGLEYALVPRPGYQVPGGLPTGVQVLPETEGVYSSTAVRTAFGQGRQPLGLDPQVERYISNHRLYGAPRAGSPATAAPSATKRGGAVAPHAAGSRARS